MTGRIPLSPPVSYRSLLFNDLQVLFSGFTHLNTHLYLPLFTVVYFSIA